MKTDRDPAVPGSNKHRRQSGPRFPGGMVLAALTAASVGLAACADTEGEDRADLVAILKDGNLSLLGTRSALTVGGTGGAGGQGGGHGGAVAGRATVVEWPDVPAGPDEATDLAQGSAVGPGSCRSCGLNRTPMGALAPGSRMDFPIDVLTRIIRPSGSA